MSLDVLSNAPLRSVPDDYCPHGSERWFSIPDGHDAGKKLFYFDHCHGDSAQRPVVLLVHGNPECSYTYRHVWKALIDQEAPFRLIAVDQIGFGVSDQASFEMIDMHHAFNLKRLVEHLDLRDITLVVHDWGGPIGFGAFLDRPDRVSSLVVLNSTIFPMPKQGPTYENHPRTWMPWCKFPSFTPDAVWGGASAFVVLNGNPQPFLASLVRAYVFQMRFLLRRVPKGTPEWVFSESLRGKRNARSSKRNVLQTPVWGYGYSYVDPVIGKQDNHEFYKLVQHKVAGDWGAAGRNIPAAGHFGAYDPCGKDSVIRQWHEAFPRMARLTHSYPDIGHFVEEHKGTEIAASILALNSAAH